MPWRDVPLGGSCAIGRELCWWEICHGEMPWGGSKRQVQKIVRKRTFTINPLEQPHDCRRRGGAAFQRKTASPPSLASGLSAQMACVGRGEQRASGVRQNPNFFLRRSKPRHKGTRERAAHHMSHRVTMVWSSLTSAVAFAWRCGKPKFFPDPRQKIDNGKNGEPHRVDGTVPGCLFVTPRGHTGRQKGNPLMEDLLPKK